MGAITRIDSPVTLRERVDRGDIVFNYGLQFVYRNQGTIVIPGNTRQPAAARRATGRNRRRPASCRQPRYFGAYTLTPDVWFKLHYKALTIEFEGIGIYGKIQRPGILSKRPNEPLTLFQLGWVLASELRLYRDALYVGIETGGATGDSAEAPGQYLNYRWRFAQQPTATSRSTTSIFRPTITSTRSCSATSSEPSPTRSTSSPRPPTGSTWGAPARWASTAASSTAWRRSRCRCRATT